MAGRAIFGALRRAAKRKSVPQLIARKIECPRGLYVKSNLIVTGIDLHGTKNEIGA